jgi:hypothetical protein
LIHLFAPLHISGYFICTECGTQSQDFVSSVYEDDFDDNENNTDRPMQTGAFNYMRRLTIKSADPNSNISEEEKMDMNVMDATTVTLFTFQQVLMLQAQDIVRVLHVNSHLVQLVGRLWFTYLEWWRRCGWGSSSDTMAIEVSASSRYSGWFVNLTQKAVSTERACNRSKINKKHKNDPNDKTSPDLNVRKLRQSASSIGPSSSDDDSSDDHSGSGSSDNESIDSDSDGDSLSSDHSSSSSGSSSDDDASTSNHDSENDSEDDADDGDPQTRSDKMRRNRQETAKSSSLREFNRLSRCYIDNGTYRGMSSRMISPARLNINMTICFQYLAIQLLREPVTLVDIIRHINLMNITFLGVKQDARISEDAREAVQRSPMLSALFNPIKVPRLGYLFNQSMQMAGVFNSLSLKDQSLNTNVPPLIKRNALANSKSKYDIAKSQSDHANANDVDNIESTSLGKISIYFDKLWFVDPDRLGIINRQFHADSGSNSDQYSSSMTSELSSSSSSSSPISSHSSSYSIRRSLALALDFNQIRSRPHVQSCSTHTHAPAELTVLRFAQAMRCPSQLLPCIFRLLQIWQKKQVDLALGKCKAKYEKALRQLASQSHVQQESLSRSSLQSSRQSKRKRYIKSRSGLDTSFAQGANSNSNNSNNSNNIINNNNINNNNNNHLSSGHAVVDVLGEASMQLQLIQIQFIMRAQKCLAGQWIAAAIILVISICYPLTTHGTFVRSSFVLFPPSHRFMQCHNPFEKTFS